MTLGLEILWPTVCAGCDVEGRGRLCPFCRTHLVVRRAPVRVEGARGTLATASFETPIGGALKRAKYGGDRALMALIASSFARVASPWVAGGVFDAIVAAPSPWTHRLKRGFSPASLLAASLGRATGVPVVHALSLRRGLANAGLPAAARRTNLRGRVRSRRGAPGTVLLVDDVVTTGATASACTRELLGADTGAVWVFALCATPPRTP